jgi:hypothetical protein
MADSAKPNGKLTTGGVGGILLCAAFVLFLVGGGLGMGGMQAAGGLGLIGMILLIGGGICAAMGFFGLGKIYGGTNGIGGVFTLIMGVMPVVLLIVGIIFASSMSGSSMSDGGARAAGGIVLVFGIVFLVSIALAGILGGLGVMGAKAGLAKPAGILLIIGGVAALVTILQAFGALPASLGNILGYVMSGGYAAGFLLAGLTMFAERG